MHHQCLLWRQKRRSILKTTNLPPGQLPPNEKRRKDQFGEWLAVNPQKRQPQSRSGQIKGGRTNSQPLMSFSLLMVSLCLPPTTIIVYSIVFFWEDFTDQSQKNFRRFMESVSLLIFTIRKLPLLLASLFQCHNSHWMQVTHPPPPQKKEKKKGGTK